VSGSSGSSGSVGRRPGVDAAPGIETVIARLLTVGTYLAMGLVLLGVVGMLVNGIDPLDHGAFPPFDLRQIPAEMLALQPAGFLWAGIVVVMCLPLGRVIVAGLGFLRVGDRRLAAVSLGVLLVVLVSILAALRPGG
jgi:uncharacterized membrane protein